MLLEENFCSYLERERLKIKTCSAEEVRGARELFKRLIRRTSLHQHTDSETQRQDKESLRVWGRLNLALCWRWRVPGFLCVSFSRQGNFTIPDSPGKKEEDLDMMVDVAPIWLVKEPNIRGWKMMMGCPISSQLKWFIYILFYTN